MKTLTVKRSVSFRVYGVRLFEILFLLLSFPLPAGSGLYKWLVKKNPPLTGLFPAFASEEWGFTPQQLNTIDLTGQNAIVTGANSGVGYETALQLAKRGANVTLACRNADRCKAAAENIKSKAPTAKPVTMVLDTSSLESVKAFAQDYLSKNNDEALDMLFLNAGIGIISANEDGSTRLSEDGIKLVFATNVVGHHLLYKLLEPLLFKSKIARVVLTSSAASFDTFNYKVATDIETLNSVEYRRHSWKVYGQSKLAQILLTKELTRRLGPSSNIYVNAAHPGCVNTNVWDKIPGIPAIAMKLFNYVRERIMWTSAEGALTMLYVGVDTEELVKKNIRGRFFLPQATEVVNPFALDQALQKNAWAFCDDLVKDFTGIVT